jgi:hypothetical protein
MSITKSILKSQSERWFFIYSTFFFCVALVVLSLLFFWFRISGDSCYSTYGSNRPWNLFKYFFGVIFEMYKLQGEQWISNIASTILTATTTALVYLLTPIFSLFSHQIVYKFNFFFFVVFGGLIVWLFVLSNRFINRLFCENRSRGIDIWYREYWSTL